MKLKSRPIKAPERFYEAPEAVECSQMIDGWLRTWKEYVPSCYDGSKKVPLVLSVHGAAHHHADRNTAWQLVAERENIIIVYPHSLIEGIKFNSWNDYSASDNMPNDIEYFDSLIDIVCSKYKIDEERIYIQGQSVGDTMASSYVFEHGNRLAAAALLSGPQGTAKFVSASSGNVVLKPKYALPVIRTHGSEDVVPLIGSIGKICVFGLRLPDREDHSDEGRKAKWLLNIKVHNWLWSHCNNCSEIPRIGVRGKYNWLVYDGQPEDYIFYIVEGGEHGPYLDMADNIWRYFFSHYRRVDGKVERLSSQWRIEPDVDAVAIADGAGMALVNNKIVPMSDTVEAARVVDDLYYVPVAFLERAFPGVHIQSEQSGTAARITTDDGHCLYLAMGNRVAVLDNHLVDLGRILYYADVLYVPIALIAHKLFGLQVSQGHDVCYISAHAGLISYDLAYFIKELLGAEAPVPLRECAKMELEMLRRRESSGQDKYIGGEAKIFDALFQEYLESVKDYKAKKEGNI